MATLDSLLAKALNGIRRRGEERVLRPMAIAAGGRLLRDGRSFLDFSSNDYLGLSQHPLVKQRSAEWASRYGAGAGASRLVSGTSPLHVAVEDKIARFKGTEAALLFASGWQANAAVLPALLKAVPDALVFTDRLIHSSLHQGCAAAGVRQIRFRHNDLGHLEQLLEERGGGAGPRFIVTESLFSMDGDLVDLGRLTAIARKHDAFLFVDEAHATGVIGPRGAGLSATVAGVDLVMGTFSKAMGSFGAYVAGSRLLCDYLVNACSGFVFSTAPPPAVLGAIDAALDVVPEMDAERAKLSGLGGQLRRQLIAEGYEVGSSASHIVPLIVGEARAAVALSRNLEENGILAAAIRPPTVPSGSSRLRLALRSAHSEAELAQLLAAIAAVRLAA